jgi:glutathione S-transferase
MKYHSVAEAKDMEGLRLALTAQSPGPWSISARALFDVRGVAFVPVRQDAMQPNEELVAWTGRRNAPVAVWNDEPPVDGWLEITNLAERLGSGPSLWPDDPVDCALAAGFSSEICGQGGFGWSRRLGMLAPGAAQLASADDGGLGKAIGEGYGLRDEAMQAADARVVQILHALTGQLKSQQAAGRRYLVGDRLSVCDVHWACFSLLVAPLAEADCPLADYMQAMFTTMADEVRDALDPLLIAHREMVWREHIGLPLDYLPDGE